jgi:hypothetical protein
MGKLILFISFLQVLATSAALPLESPTNSSVQPAVVSNPTAFQATRSLVAAPAKAPSTSPDPIPAYKLYTYYGDRYRDPFIPLIGEVRSDQYSDKPPSISSLTLKGILVDAQGRVALLMSGNSSYILRKGRLYNGHNIMVKGISGIVKTNSVILIGSDRTVREIKEKTAL